MATVLRHRHSKLRRLECLWLHLAGWQLCVCVWGGMLCECVGVTVMGECMCTWFVHEWGREAGHIQMCQWAASPSDVF